MKRLTNAVHSFLRAGVPRRTAVAAASTVGAMGSFTTLALAYREPLNRCRCDATTSERVEDDADEPEEPRDEEKARVELIKESEDEEEKVQISVPRALSQVSQTNQRRRGVEFLILTALRRHRERYNRRRRARRRRAVASSGARARRGRARQIHHHFARVGR